MNVPILRHLGEVPFETSFNRMREFTRERLSDTPDEIWLLTHPSVYTLGLNGDPSHVLGNPPAPLIRTDRGGQVTWHGPGQLVVYTLMDLQRLEIGIRAYVTLIEQAIIALLVQYGLSAESRREAPGVYVSGAKIASVGLKVTRGRCYHGFSLNVNPDLSAFDHINPCGYVELKVTSLERLGVLTTTNEVMPGMIAAFLAQPPLQYSASP
ncbi:MAG: lipoate-protein ligase [Pseudomonadota bacterium]